ncbi:hypothetical protein BDV38DRAFT_13393 [Aspergillus pseudotamarii]|uniref:Uncharacterized protein n=1 Tax=Aspergillus pseudotamarii TaxID=132259 RepID=A0A5N6SAH7_ASPPS|nr:uncharacterized protein BDV38DRAFT_13393 [Aspergillus pseudotamarii]KAE8131728.1 hypothetical protein BDV38DRAFT_13393 [Aspergillus pseudotamarii]
MAIRAMWFSSQPNFHEDSYTCCETKLPRGMGTPSQILLLGVTAVAFLFPAYPKLLCWVHFGSSLVITVISESCDLIKSFAVHPLTNNAIST